MNDRDPASSPFEASARAAFDASVDALDGRTRSRLNQARHAALAEIARPAAARWLAWAPAGALAAAAVLAVALWTGPAAPPDEAPQAAAAVTLDDLTLVAEAAEAGLMEEDPEFYAWAALEAEDIG